MVHTFELPLDHEGRLQKIERPRLPKYGIYVIRFDQEVVRVGESSSGADRIIKGLRNPESGSGLSKSYDDERPDPDLCDGPDPESNGSIQLEINRKDSQCNIIPMAGFWLVFWFHLLPFPIRI
jgi:hypothetical protein